MIDEVRIYDRELAPAEVEMLWKEGNIATGIEYKSIYFNNNQLKIYPNPTNGNFKLFTDGSKKK